MHRIVTVTEQKLPKLYFYLQIPANVDKTGIVIELFAAIFCTEITLILEVVANHMYRASYELEEE